MKRILVAGSRVWQYDANNLSKVAELNEAIATYLGPEGWDEEVGMPTEHIRIVVGDCPTGMDLIAREWAINNWVVFEEFKADWLSYGSAAGPIRNQEMVNTAPDVCLGFPVALSTWSGTIDCMTRADEAGITVYTGGVQWHAEPWMLERRIDV